MFVSGLLILTQPSKLLVPKLKDFLTDASRKIRKTLYVKLESDHNLRKPTAKVDSQNLCYLVPKIYSQASQHCSHLDVRVLQSFSKHHDHHISGKFQVVLSDSTFNLNPYLIHQFNVDPTNLPIHLSNDTTQEELLLKTGGLEDKAPLQKVFNWVCLGGTFDRLHNGHKVLLSAAINLCSEELIIGVTDGAMIKNKTLCEIIAPAEQRMKSLTEFLQEVQPRLSYRVETILDPFGPSITVPKLQCIVVSEETRTGGDAVNRKRVEKGMSALEVYEVSLVEDGQRQSSSEESKVSSSSLRRRCLGTFLKEPSPRPSLRTLPHIIGLTGGIASGKSSIGHRLQALGAGLLDCDRLAHQSYASGTLTYTSLVQEFGEEILSSDGSIDRRLLGKSVFGNEVKRQKLNSLVWPAVAKMAADKVQDLFANGHQVVVMEAALLLEAGWQDKVHHVWVAIIPEKEAVRRVVSRDGLSQEDAIKRIESQMTNAQRVAQANMLFSTLWEPEDTQKQVEKGWSALKEYLVNKNICRL